MRRTSLFCVASGLALLLLARCGNGATGGQACPGAPPEDGTACSANGRRCEYGDDPRPSCRGFAECTDGRWSRAYAKCPALPSAECPAQRPAPGAACSSGLLCRYEETSCNCSSYCSGSSCSPTPAFHWICWEPPADARCPRQVPVLGSSCSEPELKCTYGTCGAWWHGVRVCTQGIWEHLSSIDCAT